MDALFQTSTFPAITAFGATKASLAIIGDSASPKMTIFLLLLTGFLK